MKKKTGILLLNLGTPDSPSVKDVKKYLMEFLTDGRVIDINALGRLLLVNFIIVPTRGPKSAIEYEKLFKIGNGSSPLLTYGKSIQRKVQELSDDNCTVELAMRYGNPSMEATLDKMEKENYDKVVIFPLYPQYASATTGSTIERAFQLINYWQVIPELEFVGQFYDNENYLNTIINRASQFKISQYDKILFSYHGVPERQIDKGHTTQVKCSNCTCNKEYNSEEPLCYKNTCFQTSRLIAEKLNLKETDYETVFQSRLGKDPWLTPYADQTIVDLGKSGNKNLLVFSPAFVADCLETILEIGEEYLHLFQENGGDKLDLVPSLNDGDDWAQTIHNLVSH